MKRKNQISILILSFVSLLFACGDFNGIRTPRYDGVPFEPNEEAIEAYHARYEVVGPTTDYYFREEPSEDLFLSSLEFTEDNPVLLEEGTYIVGQDLPEGRAYLIGNESYLAEEGAFIRLGNLKIWDENDDLFYENHFHTFFGETQAFVDLYEGHRIEIIGENPQITVFYEESPDDLFVLMDSPPAIIDESNDVDEEELEEEGAEIEETIVTEEEDGVLLQSGIWEVGEHLDAGKYTIRSMSALRTTEVFLYREGENPRVYELDPVNFTTIESSLQSALGIRTREELEELYTSGGIDTVTYEYWMEGFEQSETGVEAEDTQIIFELEDGDKLSFSMIRSLQLELIEEVTPNKL